MHGLFVPTFLLISTFAQTATVLIFINPTFPAILIISHIQCPQASIDGYAQGFPETTFLKPAPLPSEKLYQMVLFLARCWRYKLLQKKVLPTHQHAFFMRIGIKFESLRDGV